MANRTFSSALAGMNTVDLDSIRFLMFSDEDIRKLSVLKITDSTLFDAMGNCHPGGLYDPALGPLRDRFDTCATCGNVQLYCPGHFGHIELPVFVMNPLFTKTIYTLFRISCLRCFKIQMDDQTKLILKLQLQLVDAGHVLAALDLGQIQSAQDKKYVEKLIKKYKKLLNSKDGVTEMFHVKRNDKIRSNIITGYFKTMNIMQKCMYCQQKLIKVNTSEGKIMCSTPEKSVKVMMPDEIKQNCASIAENDGDILKYCIPLLNTTNVTPPTNIFFMEVVPVIPPWARPCNVIGRELVHNMQTDVYRIIFTKTFDLRVVFNILSATDQTQAINALDQKLLQQYHMIPGTNPMEKLYNAWQGLQKSVNSLLSSDGTVSKSRGLKQVFEKKYGILRMNMMGKRVNFAARSVITPDPNVEIDEIGVPDEFAKKLTYPVPVTEWNVDELRKMIINGPNVHPGAKTLEIENGRTIRIPPDSIQKRKSLAKRLLTPDEHKSSGLKIVHRHLINGDVMILNRQPSLHKPSMMAHKARILKGEKTLRLHYANCKSYNADFDGDEMNAHFPQNEVARSEAYNIMSVRKQYLVPKDGTPLSGLIQDHVISGVKMSLRGVFFTKADYQQLVFQALSNHRGEIKLLPPTILKPVQLWSGKQILSTVIINTIPKGAQRLFIKGKAKISFKAWQNSPPRPWNAGGTPFSNPYSMSEAEVIIRNGELLCGVLDKTHYGATPYGLVHCMYELYGGDSSSSLLSSFSKIFTSYLQSIGFTLGVKDILVVEDANMKRDDQICLIRSAGRVAALKATDLPADVDDVTLKNTIEELITKDPKFKINLDRQYKNMLDSYTNNINKACLSDGLFEKFPYNNLQLMVQSGAKGSTVNTMQISCLLGQIELEGKRPPLMISGRSLPSFPPYDTAPRAGGFVDGRFMTGIQPQEFFFHCMAGREGLIDTAVKTSRSGYLQRCLIKHLESLSVQYDHTVRDSDGSIIQFAYGEDGLDVLKCQYLKDDQLKFLDENSSNLITESAVKMLKENTDSKIISKSQKSLKKWKKKYGSPLQKTRMSAFTQFSMQVKTDIVLEELPTDRTRDPYYWEIEKLWRSLDNEEKSQYVRKTCPDPLSSKHSPEYKLGVVSENFDAIIEKYLKNRDKTLSHVYTEKEKFLEVINAKYLASMAAPGEPVGLLAAQSIGEPSTQMTLNTFHFAGRGDMNVTLGIPRLREILMLASANLKTPNMDIPFRSDISNVQKKAERLRQKLNRVTVSNVLEKVDVQCEVVTEPNRNMKTTMRFTFLPHSQYKTQYSVKPRQIIRHMQHKFFVDMFTVIRKQAKASSGIVWATESNKKSRRKNEKDDEDEDDQDAEIEQKTTTGDLDNSSDEEGGNDDEDNTDAKLRQKRSEAQEYEGSDPEDEYKSDEEDEQDVEFVVEKDPDAEEVMPTAEEEQAARAVLGSFHNATNYKYDIKHHQWCELTVLFPISFLKVDLSQAVRDVAENSVIHSIKNIKRAITNKENDELYLKTEGINIVHMFEYSDILDVNRLYSNDIHAIANTYGIEAASKVIVSEIQNVFKVYGIQVDPRHLTLIADYMTFNGIFQPMNRRGIENSSSPLQQMTFEGAMGFINDAIVNTKTDNIRSASSCLVIGQPCRYGTGAFTLRQI